MRTLQSARPHRTITVSEGHVERYGRDDWRECVIHDGAHHVAAVISDDNLAYAAPGAVAEMMDDLMDIYLRKVSPESTPRPVGVQR